MRVIVPRQKRHYLQKLFELSKQQSVRTKFREQSLEDPPPTTWGSNSFRVRPLRFNMTWLELKKRLVSATFVK